MRSVLIALAVCLLLVASGCNNMPEEEPGYSVQVETTAVENGAAG